MEIIIKAKNAQLTPEGHKLVEEKIGSLDKYFDGIIKAHVEVGINSMHHQKGNIYIAEVELHVPGKQLMATAETEDVQTSIDKVKDILKRELIKYKEMLQSHK